MRVQATLRSITDRLAAAGIEAARPEATWLVCAAYGLRPSELLLRDGLPDDQLARLEAMVARRAAREPLQHVLGTAPFRHLELQVGPGVFVPRPETELLVDEVLPALRELAAPIVVDLCAGSGALALAVAHELPTARVVAVERSADAVTWLRRNAAGSAVAVVAGDVNDPDLLAGMRGSVDAVVSNPPYVPAATAVSPEVRADPAEAVFAGDDGLALMRAVIARAADLLRAGGLLVVEHDESHGEALPRLIGAAGGWVDVRDHVDLTGRPRYATTRRS
jgi:release factor glutamine methyltransferase